MSIVDYLYRGAPTGERAAVQTAVQNTPYSTIGKNIIAEGAFGKGSNLRGFDPNFKGGTNLFNYVKGGISSLFGGKAPGNIGGGTPAQRQLFEKVLQSPITRTVGPVVRSALSLPMTLAASGPYAISKLMEPRTEAGFNYMKDFDKGAITSIADAENAFDFENFGKGIMAADAAATQKAALENALIDATPIFASEDIAARNVGVPQDNRFTGIMRNIARGPLFSGGVQAGLTAGEILTGAANIPLALAGGIASQFLPLGRSKPDMDYQYVNDPNNMGGLRVVDNKIVDPSGILSGKNFESAFGSKNLGEMYDKEIGRLDNFITDLEEEEELTDRQKARLDRLTEKRQIARNRLQDYLMSTETIPGTNMTRGQFARDYNLGIGQFAMPTTDVTGKTLDYTGESDTYAGGESTPGDDTSYSDPYDPGGGE
jgi:hypothetical protein